MSSKFARSFVYIVLAVACHVQASVKPCQCPHGVADSTCAATLVRLPDIKCISCDDGYFLAGGHCQACGIDVYDRMGFNPYDLWSYSDIFDNATENIEDHRYLENAFRKCSKCGAGGECEEVTSPRFYIEAGIATSCQTGCRYCTVGGKCEVAMDGWYLDSDNKLGMCTEGCAKCTEKGKCMASGNAAGFRLDAQNKPEACSTGCKQCDADKAQCGEQWPGYWLDGGEVGRCASNCSACSKTECTTAAEGFRTTSGATEVDWCGEFCKRCNATHCIEAEDGFLVYGEDRRMCKIECATCDLKTYLSGTCLTAREGFLIDADGVLQECPVGCNLCQGNPYGAEDNTDKTKCDRDGMEMGYFLKGRVPVKCPEGCASCAHEKSCILPLPTHYMNDEGNLATCGDTCEFCIGKKCIWLKSGKKPAGGATITASGTASGSVNSVLSMGVAFAVGVATTQL